MNSFQVKISWKKMRKGEIKIIVPFRSVPTRCVIENSKQIAKKLKNTIMNSFQAKIGGKKMRNKNYHSVPFLMRNRNFQTNS